jgi:hypothetical protein
MKISSKKDMIAPLITSWNHAFVVIYIPFVGSMIDGHRIKYSEPDHDLVPKDPRRRYTMHKIRQMA